MRGDPVEQQFEVTFRGSAGERATVRAERDTGDVAGVPGEKIVMSVPYFGYEWPTASDAVRSRTRGPGRSLTLAPVDSANGGANRISARLRAAEHGLLRDSLSQVPYYVYSDSSGTWQGWFEDEHSLSGKYRFVQNNGLRGVAIFPLAYGDEATHNTLRDAFGRAVAPASSP